MSEISVLKNLLDTQSVLLSSESVLESILQNITFLDFIVEVSKYPRLYDVLNSENKQGFWRTYYLKQYPNFDVETLYKKSSEELIERSELQEESSEKVEHRINTWFEQCCIQENNYFFNSIDDTEKPFDVPPWSTDILDTTIKSDNDMYLSKLNNIKQMINGSFVRSIIYLNGEVQEHNIEEFEQLEETTFYKENNVIILFENGELYIYFRNDEDSSEDSFKILVMNNVEKIWKMAQNQYENSIGIFTYDKKIFTYNILNESSYNTFLPGKYERYLTQINFDFEILNLFDKYSSDFFGFYFSDINNVIYLLDLQKYFRYEFIKMVKNEIPIIINLENVNNQGFKIVLDINQTENEYQNEDENEEDLEIVQFYHRSVYSVIIRDFSHDCIYLNKKGELHYVFYNGQFDYNLSIFDPIIKNLVINKIKIHNYYPNYLQINHKNGVTWLKLRIEDKIYNRIINDINEPIEGDIRFTGEMSFVDINKKISENKNIFSSQLIEIEDLKIKDIHHDYSGVNPDSKYFYILDNIGNLYKYNSSTFSPNVSMRIDKKDIRLIANNVEKMIHQSSDRIIGLKIRVNKYIIVPYEHYLFYTLNNLRKGSEIQAYDKSYIIFQLINSNSLYKAYLPK